LRLFKKCISKRKNQDFSQASIECAYRKWRGKFWTPQNK
jgi:hypothetical protein